MFIYHLSLIYFSLKGRLFDGYFYIFTLDLHGQISFSPLSTDLRISFLGLAKVAGMLKKIFFAYVVNN